MNPVEADILLKIYKNEKISDIKKWCIKKLNFVQSDADIFIQSIQDLINQQRAILDNKSDTKTEDDLCTPIKFNYQKYYKISDKVFFVEYATADIVKYYGDYAIIWFKAFNQFVIINKHEAGNQNKINTIKSKVAEEYIEIKQYSCTEEPLNSHEHFNYRNYYNLNGVQFAIYYETEDLQTLINPKFDYLNSDILLSEDPYFVYWQDQEVILQNKNKVIFLTKK